MTFQYNELDVSKDEVVEIRTAPFGPPQERDNEPYNPGRLTYASSQGSSYSTRDPRKFFFIDEMEMYTTKEDWQSGPSDNDPARDHVSEHAGYWSSPGGENCDWDNFSGPGDPHKPTTFSMTIAGKRKKNMIYNIGHGTWMSTAEGVDYGVVGISGHIGATYDNNYLKDGVQSFASVGIQHIYCMYRADTDEDEVTQLIEQLQELETWFLEISDQMDEIFPEGIPDNLEQILESELNSNTDSFSVDNPQLQTVGEYSQRAFSSLFSAEKIDKLKTIVFRKNSQTMRVLRFLQEIMGREFSNSGELSNDTYTNEIGLEYIESLFKSPHDYSFNLEDNVEEYYDKDDLLITGVEIMMWVFHSFFGGTGNIDAILESLDNLSRSNSGKYVSRNYETEPINAYWTEYYKDEPNWDSYALVSQYDGIEENKPYIMKNDNDYPVSLWWSDPVRRMNGRSSIFGGIVEAGDIIETTASGMFLTLGAIVPNRTNESWNKIAGVRSQFVMAQAVSHYAAANPDFEQVTADMTNFKELTGYGYYQSAQGTKPQWAAASNAGKWKGTQYFPGVGDSVIPYHDTWLDPKVKNGKITDKTETARGHNTVCTWLLPCGTKTDNKDRKYVAHYPKSAQWNYIQLWQSYSNTNVLNDAKTVSGGGGGTGGGSGSYPATHQWKPIKVMKFGDTYKFRIKSDKVTLIGDTYYAFIRVGVLPVNNKPDGGHYFLDPSLHDKSVTGPVQLPPVKGIPLNLTFFPTDSEPTDPLDIKKYTEDCTKKGGTLVLKEIRTNPDGTRSNVFECVDPSDGTSKKPPIEPENAIPPQKLVEIPDPEGPLMRVKYNDPPGNWRTGLPPSSGQRWIYYIIEWGQIIYWNDKKKKWLVINPAEYRYETITSSHQIPNVIDSDEDGDICVMRTKWGLPMPGDPNVLNPTTNRTAGTIYIMLLDNWVMIGNFVRVENETEASADTDEFEFFVCHNNSTFRGIKPYYGPDEDNLSETNLHVTDKSPNYMIYINSPQTNSIQYQDYKHGNLVWMFYPNQGIYEEPLIPYIRTAVPEGPPGDGDPILVHVEKHYPDITSSPDYGSFQYHSTWWGWNHIQRRWVEVTPPGTKTRTSGLIYNPGDPPNYPTGEGQFYYNTVTRTLYISWWHSYNDGGGKFNYIWVPVGEVPTIYPDTTIPTRDNSDYVELFFRIVTEQEFPQLVTRNSNGDPSRFDLLIIGKVPEVDSDYTITWKYFQTPPDVTDPPANTTTYNFVRIPGSETSRIIRKTNYGNNNPPGQPNGIVEEDIFIQNTRARNVGQPFKLHGFNVNQEEYELSDTSFSDSGNGLYPHPFVNGSLIKYKPDQILVFCDGIKESPIEDFGCVQYQNDTGFTSQIFDRMHMIITDDPDDFPDGANGAPDYPLGRGNFTSEDTEPFLIFRNPESLPGSGPVYKWFKGKGWVLLVPGRIETGDDSFSVTIGTSTGDYSTDPDWEDTTINTSIGTSIGVRRPSSSGSGTSTGTSTGTDYYTPHNKTWTRRTPGTLERSTQTSPPPPNTPGLVNGSMIVVTPEPPGRSFDYNNRRTPDNTIGSGGSDVSNYDTSTIYVLTPDESGERTWIHTGTIYDTTDRTNVTNVPPNLNTGDSYIFNDTLTTVSNRSGVSNYTTITSETVPPLNEEDPPSTAPPPSTHTGSRPPDPPNPPAGSRYEFGPFISIGINVNYGPGNINEPGTGGGTGTGGDGGRARYVNINNGNIYNYNGTNHFWYGKDDPDSPSPSTTEGDWNDQSTINVDVGPRTSTPLPNRTRDGDMHFRVPYPGSRSGSVLLRSEGDWVTGPPGSATDDDVPIIDDDDTTSSRSGDDGDTRLRRHFITEDYDDPEDIDGSIYRYTFESFDESNNIWRPIATSSQIIDDADDPIGSGDIIVDSNTRMFYGESSNRPDWDRYTQLYTWRFNAGDKIRFVYNKKGPDNTYPRHPSDIVSLWWSSTNNEQEDQWTRDGALNPGESLDKTVQPNRTFCRVAVKQQKSPNTPVTRLETWDRTGVRFPLCAAIGPTDSKWSKFETGLNSSNGNTRVLEFDDTSGEMVWIEYDPDGYELRRTREGGWLPQIMTVGSGDKDPTPPNDDEDDDPDTDTGGGSNYGPEVSRKPSNSDHIDEGSTFPLKSKKGDLWFKKPENRLQAYDGTPRGWVKVGTGPCPNTKTPPDEPDAGDMYYHPSRTFVYIYDSKKWVISKTYRPTSNPDNNTDIGDGIGDDVDDRPGVDLTPGDAVGIIETLASCSKYAAIAAGVIIGCKAVGAYWLKKKETDFLAECKVIEPGHELAIGFGSNNVDDFCLWTDLNHKFINMTISEESRVITQLLKCRFNGYMFHLTCKDGSGQSIRQMKVHSVVPTYTWGLLEMYNEGALRVMREYPQNATNSHPDEGHQWGVQVDRSFKLDTRKRLIDNQGVMTTVLARDEDGNIIYDEEGQETFIERLWNHQDAWFKPQTSVCLRTTSQGTVYTKAREPYILGDLGLEWIKAEGTTSGHPEVSGLNKNRTGPGLYVMNIFNDIGAGSKYYEHYNTTNSSHAWVWEVLAHEPRTWPLEFSSNNMQVGMQFDIGSINVNRDQPRAARDWQINYLHLSFETVDGEMKSVKMIPDPGYVFRDSESFSNVPTHLMGQLENDQYRRITVWSETTVQFDDLFWGFAINAWIGTEYAGDRWRNYNIKNLKPLIRVPQ